MNNNIFEATSRLPVELVKLNQYLDCAIMVLEEEEQDPSSIDFVDLFELVFFSNYWCHLFADEVNKEVPVDLSMKLEKIRESYQQIVTGLNIGLDVAKALK